MKKGKFTCVYTSLSLSDAVGYDGGDETEVNEAILRIMSVHLSNHLNMWQHNTLTSRQQPETLT